jgi:hypothetical protein
VKQKFSEPLSTCWPMIVFPGLAFTHVDMRKSRKLERWFAFATTITCVIRGNGFRDCKGDDVCFAFFYVFIFERDQKEVMADTNVFNKMKMKQSFSSLCFSFRLQRSVDAYAAENFPGSSRERNRNLVTASIPSCCLARCILGYYLINSSRSNFRAKSWFAAATYSLKAFPPAT